METNRPIVFFDLETTGTNIVKDRIVQIAAIKVNSDGTQDRKETLVNPGIPIPKEASDVHGITDEMVKDSPTFKQISKSLFEFLDGSDVAGYNSDNFDVPLLSEEFDRVQVEWPSADVNALDILKIERMVNAHTLSETYKRYTGEELSGAHDAMIDVDGTIEVFRRQFPKLAEFLDNKTQVNTPDIVKAYQGDKRRVDFAGKFYETDEGVFWNFGPKKDKSVTSDPGLCSWFMTKDFPSESKRKLRGILKKARDGKS